MKSDKEYIQQLESLLKEKDKRIKELEKDIYDYSVGFNYYLRISQTRKEMLRKRIDFPMYNVKSMKLYMELIKNRFIDCEYFEFDFPDDHKIEWLGTWKELSCLTDVISNKNKYSTLANFYYRTKDNRMGKSELLNESQIRSLMKDRKFISGKDLKSYSEKVGDTTFIDSIIKKIQASS